MIVDDRTRVAIATPTKCGKTTLEAMAKRSFDRGGSRLRVIRPGQHRLSLPDGCEDYSRAMMVRNPYARLVSTWSFLSDPKAKTEWGHKFVRDMWFVEFVAWWLHERERSAYIWQSEQYDDVALWSAPARWLMTVRDCANLFGATEYVRLENLLPDLFNVLPAVEWGQPMHQNTSKLTRPGRWQDYWSPDSVRAAGYVLDGDLALGDYAKPDVLVTGKYAYKTLAECRGIATVDADISV